MKSYATAKEESAILMTKLTSEQLLRLLSPTQKRW